MDEFSDLPSQLEEWGDGTSIVDEDSLDEDSVDEDSLGAASPDDDSPDDDSPDEDDSSSEDEETSKEVTTDYDSDEVLDDELKKIDDNLKNKIINFCPELRKKSFDEIKALSVCVRDKNNNIIDEYHRTVPFVTKYERAKIIGVRAKQLDSGSKPYIQLEDTMIDSYKIAEMEMTEKKLPFIIRRPIPNGKSEFWKMKDLELLYY